MSVQQFGLTPAQAYALEVLRSFEREQRRMPSCAEFAAALGTKSKGYASTMLATLEERGAIRRLPRKSRAIAIVDDDAGFLLPAQLQQKLDSFCRLHGERADDVIADALALHLDQLEADAALAPEARS